MAFGAKRGRCRFRFAAFATFTLFAVGSSCGTARADEDLPFAPPPHRHPKPQVSAHAQGRWFPGFAMRMFAISGATEQTSIGPARTHDGAVAFEDRAVAYMNKGIISARYTDRLAFGYGSGGFEGGVAADPAVGLAPKLTEHSRPYLRLGLRAEWMRYQHFHTSLFEFPQAQLGFSLFDAPVHVDAGVLGGFVWIGRFGVENAVTEDLGDAGEIGARVAFAVKPFRLETGISRFEPRGPRPPVNAIDSFLCGAPQRVVACFRAQFHRASLFTGTSIEPIWASYVGISIGTGAAEWR
jgi:hypothetical protein